MTLQEARDLAAKITPRRLARALSVQSIAFCRGKDQHGRVRKYAVVGSSTTPGACYHVTAQDGCECRGYQQRDYCRHYDAVMLALDARAKANREQGVQAPTPAVEPARTCEDCHAPLADTDAGVLCAECLHALMVLLAPDGDDVDALAEVA